MDVGNWVGNCGLDSSRLVVSSCEYGNESLAPIKGWGKLS